MTPQHSQHNYCVVVSAEHLLVLATGISPVRPLSTDVSAFTLKDCATLTVQVLELPNRNDKIVDFQWEPRGSRFAVLHGEGPRPNLSLYAMRDMKTSARGVQHITTQAGKQANCIHWSPQARTQPPSCSATTPSELPHCLRGR